MNESLSFEDIEALQLQEGLKVGGDMVA